MTTSAGDPLAGVRQSSTEYAKAVTLLSDLISQTNAALSALPGKAETSVYRGKDPESDGLAFERGTNGGWEIWYSPAPKRTLLGKSEEPNGRMSLPLTSASVEHKLQAVSLLPKLVEALDLELRRQAKRAHEAAQGVAAVLKGLPSGVTTEGHPLSGSDEVHERASAIVRNLQNVRREVEKVRQASESAGSVERLRNLNISGNDLSAEDLLGGRRSLIVKPKKGGA